MAESNGYNKIVTATLWIAISLVISAGGYILTHLQKGIEGNTARFVKVMEILKVYRDEVEVNIHKIADEVRAVREEQIKRGERIERLEKDIRVAQDRIERVYRKYEYGDEQR